MLSNSFFKHLLVSFTFYLVLLFSLFVYLMYIQKVNVLNENNLLRFDALLYFQVNINGYKQDWLCAFFPGFPLLWKALNLSTLGISIFNSILFIISFSLLAHILNFNIYHHLFFASIPSFIFMFVPYTESLFFACCLLFIIGLRSDNWFFIILGLFFCSLVRPTTFVFIPAIFITYWFDENNKFKLFKKSLPCMFALIAGLFVTTVIHFCYTGKWFVFFEAQKLWNNYLHLPRLPLTSWGGDTIVRYDGSALAISIGFVFYLIKIFKFKMSGVLFKEKDFTFSILYLIGTSILILIYRDGNLYSLNRFIYATPFIIISLSFIYSKAKADVGSLLFIFVITELFWFLFNSFNHIHNFLMFSIVSMYFIVLLATKHKKELVSKSAYIILILFNSCGFIKLAIRFLSNEWVA